MPLVTKNLLLDAQKGGYAVGAFNVENLEMVQAVVSAAEELNAPVILQTTPSTVKYADLAYFYAMVKTAAKKPVSRYPFIWTTETVLTWLCERSGPDTPPS